ncbi:hypothetical protein, variant [Capsaspora owczarzaki ATCC 30864]|uniref:RRM domain-containing protein n=1 Tax=Capsaspora owczarzaki (strain ATCC 30864) TaxID=595528 RepID=A0A0D2U5V9_CAPO3|nr:hypothetical protein, variant [Capsaspora owczarzaki ATCC 30864]KJE90511.1 hypothetical protein CAOG_001821 [Capsaspora owczarzaki ATCC 30864]|eukprot:XP_011270062.1 hypothetical protein, variant [Capsaspora owczarzaki ATCC 30864]
MAAAPAVVAPSQYHLDSNLHADSESHAMLNLRSPRSSSTRSSSIDSTSSATPSTHSLASSSSEAAVDESMLSSDGPDHSAGSDTPEPSFTIPADEPSLTASNPNNTSLTAQRPAPFNSANNNAQRAPPATLGHRIFVGGINWKGEESDLREFFAKLGTVVECKIIADRVTGASKGYGFVSFSDAHTAEAVKQMQNLVYMGKPLHLSDAVRKPKGLDAKSDGSDKGASSRGPLQYASLPPTHPSAPFGAPAATKPYETVGSLSAQTSALQQQQQQLQLLLQQQQQLLQQQQHQLQQFHAAFGFANQMSFPATSAQLPVQPFSATSVSASVLPAAGGVPMAQAAAGRSAEQAYLQYINHTAAAAAAAQQLQFHQMMYMDPAQLDGYAMQMTQPLQHQQPMAPSRQSPAQATGSSRSNASTVVDSLSFLANDPPASIHSI